MEHFHEARQRIEEVMFSDLLDEKNALSWRESIFLADNFTSGRMPDYLSASKPRKIRFATFVLCRMGEISVRLNMRNYTLKADDALLFSPGVIGEQVHASADCKLVVVAFSESAYNITAKLFPSPARADSFSPYVQRHAYGPLPFDARRSLRYRVLAKRGGDQIARQHCQHIRAALH